MAKRKIVLNDKKKIAQVIAELDEMKKAALKKAWEQVNKVRHFVWPSLTWQRGVVSCVKQASTFFLHCQFNYAAPTFYHYLNCLWPRIKFILPSSNL